VNSFKSSATLVALSVAVLGILTAWGSAWAMLIVSAVMLGAGAAVLRGRFVRGAALLSAVGGIAVGGIVAMLVAAVLLPILRK